MTQTIYQRTMYSSTPVPQASADDSGCLLQIHPLEIEAGPLPMETTPFVVGRDETCELSIRDTSISRRHCEIRKTPAGFFISDLGSTNGTFVNDEEIKECLLKAGDQIRMGNRIFKFMTSNQFEAQYHEAVYSMMTRDSLTGVWNKRYFMDVLARELTRGHRHSRCVSLVIFDIDFFKKVNDTHGHLAGDEVLAEIGHRVSSELRSDEVFARYGGEEFAVILSEVSLADAAETAERCRRAVEARAFPTSVGELPITISVGVAVADGSDECAPSELIERADKCLYEAKRGGRNRVSF